MGEHVVNGTSLSGQCAIVTGASQGLGREISHRFLAAGANVALCARTVTDTEAAAAALRIQFPDRTIFAQTCDIADIAQIDRLFDASLAALGRIDIVVNNAGIHGPIGQIGEIDWAAWQRAIAVNLVGTAYSCHRAVRYFKTRDSSARRGKIINLSGGGATTPQPGLSAYGASKAGLVRFTETLAAEVRPFGIDVNAVAPGALATRLMAELSAAGPERIGSEYHLRVEQMRAQGGMSMTRPADLCVYLASSNSDGITGRLISATWDPWPFSGDQIRELMSSDVYTLRRITAADREFKGKRREHFLLVCPDLTACFTIENACCRIIVHIKRTI
jgi:NAD(P)-dependent dehydrogenase (short-subunit alcohol dehydrogenase family)